MSNGMTHVKMSNLLGRKNYDDWLNNITGRKKKKDIQEIRKYMRSERAREMQTGRCIFCLYMIAKIKLRMPFNKVLYCYLSQYP